MTNQDKRSDRERDTELRWRLLSASRRLVTILEDRSVEGWILVAEAIVDGLVDGLNEGVVATRTCAEVREVNAAVSVRIQIHESREALVRLDGVIRQLDDRIAERLFGSETEEGERPTPVGEGSSVPPAAPCSRCGRAWPQSLCAPCVDEAIRKYVAERREGEDS